MGAGASTTAQAWLHSFCSDTVAQILHHPPGNGISLLFQLKSCFFQLRESLKVLLCVWACDRYVINESVYRPSPTERWLVHNSLHMVGGCIGILLQILVQL